MRALNVFSAHTELLKVCSPSCGTGFLWTNLSLGKIFHKIYGITDISKVGKEEKTPLILLELMWSFCNPAPALNVLRCSSMLRIFRRKPSCGLLLHIFFALALKIKIIF